MAAATEYGLITRAAIMTLSHAEAVRADIHTQLETSGSTVLVNGLRTLTMQSTILAIGSFSVFEGLLQQQEGWGQPFAEIDQRLRNGNHIELADRFLDYRNAINALKHGDGRSYDKLIARREHLGFKIKDRDQPFFQEGDVGEGVRLVAADEAFVHQCCEIIEEVTQRLHI